MPTARGVVLASERGEALAHDLDSADASRLAQRAVALHHDERGCAPLSRASNGASICVPHGDNLVLVVFMPASSAVSS